MTTGKLYRAGLLLVAALCWGATQPRPKQGYPLLVVGKPTQEFGVRWSEDAAKLHTGLDLGAGKGDPVFAMKNGTVWKTGWLGKSSKGIDWGNYVVIKNDDGTAYAYLHVNLQKSYVDYARVKAGDNIGTVFRDHLHLNLCITVNGCQHGAFPNDTFPLAKYSSTYSNLTKFYVRPQLGY